MVSLDEMPERSLNQIPRVGNMTDEEFARDWLKKSRPVVMPNGARDWPAMRRWSFDFFRGLDGAFRRKLEIGNVLQGPTTVRETTFREFLDEVEQPTAHVGPPPYMSVFPIFRYFPELQRDVDFEMLARHKRNNLVSGWIGPAGTVTGYHIDWGDNLLAQIVGRKLVKLVSPDQSRLMYPSRKFDINTALSSVDADDYDPARFPDFARVHALYVVLEPGDILFLPRGYWHYVRSLDPSISVNSLGVGWRELIRDKPREHLRKHLHRVGLYASECTCHTIVDGRRVPR